MRAVIQRVNNASVDIDGKIYNAINSGLLIFIGIEESDNQEDILWLSGKISRLRVFNDISNVMNSDIKDVDGEILLISQFTLHASTKKGNRPSYIKSAKPDIAIPVYNDFVKQLSEDSGKTVKTGIFGSYMKINLENDGPVTIMIDTKNKE